MQNPFLFFHDDVKGEDVLSFFLDGIGGPPPLTEKIGKSFRKDLRALLSFSYDRDWRLACRGHRPPCLVERAGELIPSLFCCSGASGNHQGGPLSFSFSPSASRVSRSSEGLLLFSRDGHNSKSRPPLPLRELIPLAGTLR